MLDTKSAKGLTLGSAPSKEESTMKVLVLRGVMLNGEVPEVGSSVDASGTFGVVESVKAVSDLYAPVSGTIVEVNSRLEEEPELINSDPYNEAWIIKVKMTDSAELDTLLTGEEYASYVGAEEK